MIKHPGVGIEFDVWGFEIPEGHDIGSSNPYYADLVARVLKTAEIEGFHLDATAPKDFDDLPIIERMESLGSTGEDRRTVLMYDHEVPAVLGMFRTALANMLDEDRDRTVRDSYSYLPPGTIQIMIGSLEEYESRREIAKPDEFLF